MGGAGKDLSDGGEGSDSREGGIGDVATTVDSESDAVLENAGSGTDTVSSSLSRYTLTAHVENLILIGTGACDGTGNDLNNAISGNSAANFLAGGAGNDLLDGGSGKDTLLGGIGNDTYIIRDLADGTGEADEVIEKGGEGIDTVQSYVSTYTLTTGVENLRLMPLAIDGYGNELDNVLTGSSLSNRLYGGDGQDTIRGGDGNDRICGGGGADMLYGQSGFDTFLFDSISDLSSDYWNCDTINDFTEAEDKIDLSGIDANVGMAGNQSFTIDTDGVMSAGEIRVSRLASGENLIEVDVGDVSTYWLSSVGGAANWANVLLL